MAWPEGYRSPPDRRYPTLFASGRVSFALPWAEFFSENYMTNRERLQLVNLKVKVIKYPGENFAIFGKNEIVKILLRKAKGEKVKYNAA